MGKAKKMPRLETLTVKQRRKKGPQSWQEQMGIMSKWASKVDKAIEIKRQLEK